MILDIEPVAARARAAIAEAVRRRGRCIKRRAESPQLHAEPSARPLQQPTRADERALVLAALEGRGDARGVLVEAFLPSVAAAARLYRGLLAVSDAELMQAGVVGLLRALERFDPRIGTPFWAYASWWVRRAMQAELARPVVLPDRATRDLGRVRRAHMRRLQCRRDEPRTPKLAAEAAQLAAALTVMTARERRIMMARYGVGGMQMRLHDLGDSLSLTAERVRQIERAALDKLREAMTRGPRVT